MPNYYEILQIQPDAPAPEVEAACEAKYNYWRRLVTHHDPEMANRANQALRWLEQIRTVLLDTEKRAAYDTRVGLSGNVGGLADPQAADSSLPTAPAPSSQMSPIPPSTIVGTRVGDKVLISLAQVPPIPPMGKQVPAPVDRWICPQCQTEHIVGALYCKACGYQLSVRCPNCRKVILADAQFCPSCGVNVPQAREQKAFEEAEAERRQQEAKRRQILLQSEEEARAKALKRATLRMIIIGGVLGLIAAPIAWAIIWPDMMEMGICAVGQAIIGAIGGTGVNWWASEKLVDPLKTQASIIISIICGVLGGIFAFPAIIIGIIIAVL
jgi:predicted RNA-binding Zn-ribbon protein involved in translation (DUF1610 family)